MNNNSNKLERISSITIDFDAGSDLESGYGTASYEFSTELPPWNEFDTTDENDDEEIDIEDDLEEEPPKTPEKRFPGTFTPTPSYKAKQQEYNRNLAATMTTLTDRRHPSLISAGTTSPSSSPLKHHPISQARRKISFAVHDKVLVNLQLLNIVNHNEPNVMAQTTVPVNKHGYPKGKGRTDPEKVGPYLYLACEIKSVHTDHYMVERFDTGQMQRAEAKWGIEKLENPFAIMAAMGAARTIHNDRRKKSSENSLSDNDDEIIDYDDLFSQKQSWIDALDNWLEDILWPCFQRHKRTAKKLLTQFLHGKPPFSCKVRCTGINLLVLCSILFLFLQVLQLGWMPAEWDEAVVACGTAIWIVLVIELLFEILIRPVDYKELVASDKAYRPSTARYIHKIYILGESIALLTYLPEIYCLHQTSTDVCFKNEWFARWTLVEATGHAVLGPTRFDSVFGRLIVGSMAFRFFGVIRHWKQMHINQTFHPVERQGIEKWIIPYDPYNHLKKRKRRRDGSNSDDDTEESDDDDNRYPETDRRVDDSKNSEEKRRLTTAANIGTALMSVNCQRALLLMVLSVLALPLFYSITHQNNVSNNMAKLLQAQNLVSEVGVRDCGYLENAIDSWLDMAIVNQPYGTNKDETYVLWARVLPVRCPFQNQTGVITSCKMKDSKYQSDYKEICSVWDNPPPFTYQKTKDINIQNDFARMLGIRGSGIHVARLPKPPGSYQHDALDAFNVTVVFNQNPTIENANRFEFFLLLVILVLGIAFLVLVQNDVYTLALYPIQRMLKIVVRYAENPLWTDVADKKRSAQKEYFRRRNSINSSNDIGSIETEQLLNAVTKISDLLRKCWGVAGAGIISSNLGLEKDGQVTVFNPTVPGKQVYALFGFVTINGYSDLLKALDRDIMILINDIAKVVHDEVYRWALGEHGQCNKNLGPCFLMVWRIGDFNEVQKKNKEAIEKVFRDKVYKTSGQNVLRRRNNRTPFGGRKTATATGTTTKILRADSSGIGSNHHQEIPLESLPGIQGFTDRALIGMLKSFAGIHRDKALTKWKNDFRLSAGVSSLEYTVDIVYGMDAGWAVEGAVGSEYKIDATYLSPHVNMASRMMSASKQYGVTMLLSKAVETILSTECRQKLRHLDCVYVKGSSWKQDIYTYDARYQGVDFFLMERTPEQAEIDSDNYTPGIWDTDPDLRAMRRHVSEDFLANYHSGLDEYLAGKWEDAYKTLTAANEIMIRTVLEEGYIELNVSDHRNNDDDDDNVSLLAERILNDDYHDEEIVKLRQELGDGACSTLLGYMDRRDRIAPSDWDGVRQLFSK